MICIFNLYIGQSRCSRRYGKLDHTPLHLQSRKWRWNSFGLQTVGVRRNFHWYVSFALLEDDPKSMNSKITCVEVWWVFFRQIIHISCNLQYLIRKITHFPIPMYPGIPESLPPTRQQLPPTIPDPVDDLLKRAERFVAHRGIGVLLNLTQQILGGISNQKSLRWTCKIWLEYIDPKISTY